MQDTRAPLIAFEGLDQSGKETQARRLRDRLRASERKARVVSFPDYGTSIGEEIARALAGERDYGPDVMQLLYVANRHERKDDLERWQQAGIVLLCDRYLASTVAYGEAQGLDVTWLEAIQRFLPPPALTIYLDISPDTALERKATGRDRFEKDYALQVAVRQSYQRQAQAVDWVRIDGERAVDEIAEEVAQVVSSRRP